MKMELKKIFPLTIFMLILGACSEKNTIPDTDKLSYHTPKLRNHINCQDKGQVKTPGGEAAFYCLETGKGGTATIYLVSGPGNTLARVEAKLIGPNVEPKNYLQYPHTKALSYLISEYVEGFNSSGSDIFDFCGSEIRYPKSGELPAKYLTTGRCSGPGFGDSTYIIELKIVMTDF